MARTSSLGTQYRLQRLLTQERITGTLEEVANAHETNRQSTVKAILVHMFLMSKFGLFKNPPPAPPTPIPLRVEGAENQYFWSTGGDNAAHCAPGQIYCGADTVQKRIRTNDDLEMIVECLFSKTDGIELRFNAADSSAEGHKSGNRLRRVFGNACFQAARVGEFTRINPQIGFSHIIEQVFRTYQQQGVQAIDQAITAEQQEIARGNSTVKGVPRQEIIRILQVYR
ncbi:MAG TPA: hypothetical protein VEV84_15405, partial [Pyrinomonadaceae bacterium]|nr:hypothetical protein [Pyrinomonadaceae bacterium]